ncbi:class I SAM-dependent methyltransferase [Halovulum dunhuangense]|uniref:Class I SAM-dependent methyltransferase n=1 Tax=Halovulum dunhuangense TaxID=1505036 RepID=A0A849KZP9_9RHOB|nr:class I SAM-dependent methyltransferase [Halovulum dunhuangense]NNU79444.1 class I SAM-dependent methyltransferase [Halovulum dunhuangense]
MGFSPDWLSLREPADHAARDAALLNAAAGAAGRAPVVLDLGCGTGSTIRAFGTRLPETTRWRLVDLDPTLLEHAARQAPQAQTFRLNLSDLDALPLEGVTLVTASALLDLMPRDWVARLADRLAGAGCAFYAALNYDGMMRWTPAHPDDAGITDAFNRHQRGDKGIGPALGPDAGPVAAELFRARGFEVRLADSPWVLGPSEARLHAELAQGIARAAEETGLAADAWAAARATPDWAGSAVIGHCDLLAIPGA